MDKRPDHEAIHKALKNLSDSEIRKKMIASAGEVHTVRLDDNQVSYMQIAGIKKKDAEEIIKLTTVNGLVPEPVRAAHLVGKGAYNEVPPPVEVKDDDWIHVKAYNYIKDTHKQVHRWKHKTFPGIAGEIVSFLFAVLVAWCIIQFLGFVLGTPNPLVVIESQSMEHYTGWEQWYQKQNMSTNGFNAMNIGDIVLVKGDNPKDIQVGDVIVYTKYNMNSVGGEPIIHRVIGIADISGSTVHVQGELDASANSIRTPCGSTYSIDELKGIYSTDLVKKMYPDLDLNNFRVFITKGDNNNGEDQCKSARMVSFPVHEKLVQGRAKFDLPYVGYIKLGLVCVVRYASGNVCSSRCWWAANHPNCNSNGIVA
jgi:signal peptidase I